MFAVFLPSVIGHQADVPRKGGEKLPAIKAGVL